jgi:hypothetical protein
MAATRQKLEITPSLNALETCLKLVTHVTMEGRWSPGPAGRLVSEQVRHDVLVLRLAYARVLKVMERLTPQGARALATLAVAIRTAENHHEDEQG